MLIENKENNNVDDVVAIATNTVVVKARCQRMVHFSVSNQEKLFDINNVLLEGYKVNLSEALVAKSLHDLSTTDLYCNVVNAGDEDLSISKGFKLGRLSSVEIANEEFDNNVRNFKKLNVNELKMGMIKSQFTGYSKMTNHNVDKNINNRFELDVVNKQILDLIKGMKMGPKLKNEEKLLLQEVIFRNKNAFQWNKEELGFTRLVEHHVNTIGGPIQERQYPIHQAAKSELREQSESMIKKKIIRESNSEWRSPVLLVKKKSPDNKVTYRFCIDLKKVNAVTTKDCYSLPIIGDTVD